jgi:membrane protein YdbS with pleckstrin-like domain
MRKYTELLTVPAAIVVMWLYNLTANWFGLHTMTWEQVGKVFAAFVIFLIAVGFVRIVHIFVFPELYKYFDPSFEQNKEWKILGEKQRFIYSFWLHCVLLVLFGLIVNGL